MYWEVIGGFSIGTALPLVLVAWCIQYLYQKNIITLLGSFVPLAKNSFLFPAMTSILVVAPIIIHHRLFGTQFFHGLLHIRHSSLKYFATALTAFCAYVLTGVRRRRRRKERLDK